MKNTVSIIYKRELKQLFCSLAGWVFLALNVAALGICTVWLCFKNVNPAYQYVPETASLILCFTAPLMAAMTVGTEWKRGETAMLLRYASPVAVTIGKYLAMLTVFAVPTVICGVLPLLLIPFGVSWLVASYMSVITYGLVGAAILALCFFISTLIRQPVIGAMVSVAVSLLLNVASNVAKIIGNDRSFPFVLAAVALIAIVTVVMLIYLNNTVIPSVFAVLTSAVTLVLALSGAAPAVLRPMLMLISPQYAFYENIYGTASVKGMLQPILFTAVFLGFTALNHANHNKKLSIDLRRGGKESE